MNAHEFTFGIEIETIAPNSAVQNDGLRIGPYKRGIQVPYLPTGWKAEADGSIDNSAGGHKCEIVSPVLRGADGINQVIEVVRTLEAKGHRVNVSCGVHVHVGWDRTWSQPKYRLKAIVSGTDARGFAGPRRLAAVVGRSGSSSFASAWSSLT